MDYRKTGLRWWYSGRPRGFERDSQIAISPYEYYYFIMNGWFGGQATKG